METTEYQKINHEFHLLISKFTHEIRNPLSLVDSELQILANHYPEITSCKDWDIILNNLACIEDLLNDFSSYGNAGILSLSPTGLTEYLNALVESVQPTMSYLNIQLTAEIPANLPVIPLDQRKFRQAFLNFIRNAQDAVSSDGKISIKCMLMPEQKILLSISDNGCGLSTEQLKHIFTPFVTYKPNGTGLGLSIAKQIIDAHNGTLQINSQPDQGCTVLVTLGK